MQRERVAIKMEKIEKIKEDLEKSLSEKRYIHSIGAMEKAVELANCSQAKTLICMLGKGDETTQHEQDRYVSCLPDKDIFIHAVNALKESHDQ